MAKLIPVQKITEFRLELSLDELKVLFSLLRKVGGDPCTSYRKYTSKIRAIIEEYFVKTKEDDVYTSYFTGDVEAKECQ